MTTVWLARHGETAENAAGRILGRRDPPLSDAGRRQAAALAARAAGLGLAALYCSPLTRAADTAAAVAAATALTPQVLDDLAESDRGAWEGHLVADLAAEDPALFDAFRRGDPAFRFPGGESLAEQRARTAAALAVVRAGAAPALVVAHVGTIRAALAQAGAAVPPESSVGHGELLALD